MAKEKVTDGHGIDVEILPTANLCHRSVWRTAVDSTRAVSVRIALSLQMEASTNAENSGMADRERICGGMLQ